MKYFSCGNVLALEFMTRVGMDGDFHPFTWPLSLPSPGTI
jgi:hypothetical protein